MTFENPLSRETGLKFKICYLSQFLELAFMMEYFSQFGNTDCVSDI